MFLYKLLTQHFFFVNNLQLSSNLIFFTNLSGRVTNKEEKKIIKCLLLNIELVETIHKIGSFVTEKNVCIVKKINL